MDLTGWTGRWFFGVSAGNVDKEFPYWAVRFPDGGVRHTFLSTEQQEVIDNFIHEEQLCGMIANVGRLERGEKTKSAPRWMEFEKQGFSLVRVKVVEAPR